MSSKIIDHKEFLLYHANRQTNLLLENYDFVKHTDYNYLKVVKQYLPHCTRSFEWYMDSLNQTFYIILLDYGVSHLLNVRNVITIRINFPHIVQDTST